jgi:hypothetical protein
VNISNPITLILFLFGALSLTSACTAQTSQLEQEAQAFCDLHNPTYWQDREGYTATENIDHMASLIRDTITHRAFLEIFNRLANQKYENLYTSIKPEISRLLGHEWSCVNAEQFYTIKWQRINQGNQLEIPIIGGSDYLLIDNTKLQLDDIEGIKQEIQKIAKNRPYIVNLYINSEHTTQDINQYLAPLSQAGVERVTLIEGNQQ